MDNQLPPDSPMDTDGVPMDTSSETNLDECPIELPISPPAHYDDHDRMRQADTVRWDIRLPLNTSPKYPGFYISNRGEELLLVSVSDDGPSSTPNQARPTGPNLPVDPSQHGQSDPQRRGSDFDHAKDLLFQPIASQQAAQRLDRYAEPSLHTPPPRKDLEPLPPSIQGVTTRPVNPWSSGITIRKATENSALYTTKVSWGPDPATPSEDRIIGDVANEQELADNIEAFKMGIDTGSSLSWIYKAGYKQVESADFGVFCIKDWDWDTSKSPKPDSVLAQLHPCVDFESDVNKTEYERDEVLQYGDRTVVVAVRFRDYATFHGTGKDTRVCLTALGALAVDRALMLRDYDGLLGLSPRPAAREEKVHPSLRPILQQLVNSREINDKIFYLTFGSDHYEASLLSIGGIRKSLRDQYDWSYWMSIVPQDRADLTWSLFLDSVDIVSNTGCKNVVDSLSLDTYTFETDEKYKMHFDSGTSHSLYTEPLIDFLIKNKLILKDGYHFYCRIDTANAVSVCFNLRSGSMDKSWSIAVPGTRFGEFNSFVPNVQDHPVKRATISSAGGRFKDTNIWGNKHMRGMSIGFNAESRSLSFGLSVKLRAHELVKTNAVPVQRSKTQW